jgi:hypothetical protein
MSGIKEHALRVERRVADPHPSLEEIAEALRGEVRGRAVVAPSPGMPADDRSMVVYFNAANPASFYVYGVEGGLARARRHVLAKLRLVEMPVEDASERTEKAMAIWREATPAAGTLVEIYLRSRAITAPCRSRFAFTPGSGTGRAAARGRRWWPWSPTSPTSRSRSTGRTCRPAAGARRRSTLRGWPWADRRERHQVVAGWRGAICRRGHRDGHVRRGRRQGGVVGRLRDGPARAGPAGRGPQGRRPGRQRRRCERAANEAGCRWLREGRQVLLHRAPPGQDFNDVLMGKAS